MATLREKRPGVWEVRVFTGSDARGRPTRLPRTVHGGERDALKLAAELDVGPGRVHDLRHWSATVAIGQGHDVCTVAGRLGHANPAITLRVYADALAAAADQAVGAGLGESLTGEGK